MTDNNSDSAASPAESATADTSHPPALSAVAHTITATNRVIASAHEHGRKRVTARDALIARVHFSIARRLARLAWKFAVMGKGRVS